MWLWALIQWIHTFYKNISSCVLNNGLSTAPSSVERGVRQGDPLSAYLFIIMLDILCISVRRSKDIHEISNDNRTEWSPIRSVIIQVIIGSFRFEYENEYEYEFTSVLTLRMRSSP